jgi:hypothetical protein
MNYTLDQLKEAMDKNHAVRQDFLKTLLTIASSMLAILAALHTSTTSTTDLTIPAFLFLLTLGSLSLGILTGGIALYFDTVAAKSIYLQMKEQILLRMNDAAAAVSLASYNPPKFFYFCEKTCYISLLLAVLSISLFAGVN